MTLRRIIGALVLVVTAVGAAHAQTGVQVTRDGKRNLISKDVGNERWSIVYDLLDGSVSGNVFFPGGGPPVFLWCQTVTNDGLGIKLNCWAADRCTSAPCTQQQWNFLSVVDLPLDFFFAPGGLAPPVPDPTPTATPLPQTGGISSLLGTWDFTFTIISTFTERYFLRRVDSSAGFPAIVGEDRFGKPLVAARVRDLVPNQASSFTFAMLVSGTIICDFYMFDQTSPTRVVGQQFTVLTDSNGRCDSILGSDHAMSGTRISASAFTAGGLGEDPDMRRRAEQLAIAETGIEARPASDEPERILELLRESLPD